MERIELEIDAIKFALASYLEFEVEPARNVYLRENISNYPALTTYYFHDKATLRNALLEKERQMNSILELEKEKLRSG